MIFEDYSPDDRHLSSRLHLASWLVCAGLIGLLALAAPFVGSEDAGDQLAAAAEDDCAA